MLCPILEKLLTGIDHARIVGSQKTITQHVHAAFLASGENNRGSLSGRPLPIIQIGSQWRHPSLYRSKKKPNNYAICLQCNDL